MPTISALSDRNAVLAAIAQFDEMGRDAFLTHHGFWHAKWWYVLHKSRQYDSKAIAGVALGIQYGTDGRLNNFKGGEANVVKKLRELGFTVRKLLMTDETSRLPVEVPESYPEGMRRLVTVNVVERSAAARIACLELHGARCIACMMSFEDAYGADFSELIHVHHLNPLSGVQDARQVDPRTDLVPICPNCHAVAHYGGRLRSIAEIRDLLAAARAPAVQ